jgi:hypothetical protein
MSRGCLEADLGHKGPIEGRPKCFGCHEAPYPCAIYLSILVDTKNMEECGVTIFNVKASLENRHVSQKQCYWCNNLKIIYFTQHSTLLHGGLGVKCSGCI